MGEGRELPLGGRGTIKAARVSHEQKIAFLRLILKVAVAVSRNQCHHSGLQKLVRKPLFRVGNS